MIERLRTRIANLLGRIGRLRRRQDYWKERAFHAEDLLATSIIMPGTHRWTPAVERWRSLIHHHMGVSGGERYWQDEDRLLDLMLGVMEFESGGLPNAVCKVEWIGDEPPGYDGTPATRASGLFQHVPAYWESRSNAAGFEGRNIFDVEANVGTACWLLWDGWHPETAPNWRHWSAAHVNRQGSYEWALAQLDA